MPRTGSHLLSMTFTVEEWRMIAGACSRVKDSAFINGKEVTPKLKKIARRIATETGKDDA